MRAVAKQITLTDDEIDAGADALRRFEIQGMRLNDWNMLPNSTRKKWREKVRLIWSAINDERKRAEMCRG